MSTALISFVWSDPSELLKGQNKLQYWSSGSWSDDLLKLTTRLAEAEVTFQL